MSIHGPGKTSMVTSNYNLASNENVNPCQCKNLFSLKLNILYTHNLVYIQCSMYNLHSFSANMSQYSEGRVEARI